MSIIRQEIAGFLDGLVIGFLVASILTLIFQYVDFIPLYSPYIALLLGGFTAGIISKGLWKGGISAFFSGFFALFLFELIKGPLTLEHEFSSYQIMIGFLFAVAGGIIGGFIARPTFTTTPPGEPVKIYICPHCGSEISMKTKFCPDCGAPMRTPKEKSEQGGEKS